MKSWFSLNRKALFLLFFFFCLCYGIKLCTYSYALDTEFFMVHKEAMLLSWLGISRFSLVFLKWLTSIFPFSIFLTNWFTVVFFFLASCFTYYNFAFLCSKFQSTKKMIFFLFFLGSSPIYLEQFNFTLQSLEISFCFCLLQIGIYSFLNYFMKGSKKYFFLSLFCILFSFGAYQSFVLMFLTEMFLFFYLLVIDKKWEKDDIFKFLKYAFLFFFLSFLGYYFIGKLVISIFSVPPNHYLKDQIGWFTNPFWVSIKNILKDIERLYFGYRKEVWQFTILNTFFVIVLFYKIFLKCRDKNYFVAFLLFLFFFLPLLMTFLLGNASPIRSYFSLPILLAFVFCQEDLSRKWYKAILIVGIFCQFAVMWTLEYGDYIRFLKDKEMASHIYETVKDDLSLRALVFVGSLSSFPQDSIVQGEAMGISFFNHYGLSDRASTFLKSLGYDLVEDREFIPEATILMKDFPSYPDANSILITDSHVIVKLS